MGSRDANLWVVLKPSEDVPGQWISHCLDWDIVSQGNSFLHAIEMVAEAIGLTLLDDLQSGRDPLVRPSAPEEYWEEMRAVQRTGEFFRLDSLDMRRLEEARFVAIQLHIAWQADAWQRPPIAPTEPEVERLPPAWMSRPLRRDSGCAAPA